MEGEAVCICYGCNNVYWATQCQIHRSVSVCFEDYQHYFEIMNLFQNKTMPVAFLCSQLAKSCNQKEAKF